MQMTDTLRKAGFRTVEWNNGTYIANGSGELFLTHDLAKACDMACSLEDLGFSPRIGATPKKEFVIRVVAQ